MNDTKVSGTDTEAATTTAALELIECESNAGHRQPAIHSNDRAQLRELGLPPDKGMIAPE